MSQYGQKISRRRSFILIALLSTGAQAQWLNFPTPGTPRTRDGRPNLTAPHELLADADIFEMRCQRVYHCPSREVILEIPGNFVLKRLSSDHNLPVDLFPRRQPLIEVG